MNCTGGGRGRDRCPERIVDGGHGRSAAVAIAAGWDIWFSTKDGLGNPPISTAEPLPGDDFYLVSGDSIAVMRDGKVVNLEGTELERARRWVVDRAHPAPPAPYGGER